ncbi:MAG: flagellar basal body P-ring protein FlgI [Bradymonadales bacterium]|nr:MAG: flagellar basal body P-ring protein FlgI [Bradymonadales bacterium]
MLKRISILFLSVSVGTISYLEASTARLKDITNLQGVRDNQLIGYGLVVGLDGTGDGGSNQMTIQSMATMLNNLGVGVDASQVNSRNVASVIVTAYLPPFARQGSKMDVLVSSMGDAQSLQGGTLLLTPLKGADGEVYAVAQGPITLGGFQAAAGGARESRNHSTVGKVPSGAVIETELPFDFTRLTNLTYSLKNPDFTTANRIAAVINRQLNGSYAAANDSGTVRVRVPDQFKGRVVELVSSIENLAVRPDTVARVVVNERTGTVVVGEDVRISTVAVAHGNLTISIQPQTVVSQPEAFSDGQTVVVDEPFIEVQEGDDNFALLPGGVSIGDLVRALNALGISPRDLISVFQAIQASGALQAELEII